jgi:hypothetical protein
VIDDEVIDKVVWKNAAEVPILKKVEDLLPGELLEFEVICTVE